MHGILKDGREHYGEFNWLGSGDTSGDGGTISSVDTTGGGAGGSKGAAADVKAPARVAAAASGILGTEAENGWWFKTTVKLVSDTEASPDAEKFVYIQSRGEGRNWECREVDLLV